MPLENDIQALTAAVVNLANVIQATRAQPAAPTPVVQAAPPPPAAPAPVAPTLPFPGVPMPASIAPTGVPQFGAATQVFAAPAAAPVAPTLPPRPFNDVKGCIEYVVARFHELGPQKGPLIQQAMAELGITNIASVKPEQFDALYQRVAVLS